MANTIKPTPNSQQQQQPEPPVQEPPIQDTQVQEQPFVTAADVGQGINYGMQEAVTGLASNLDKAAGWFNNTLNVPELANIDANGDGQNDGLQFYSRSNYNDIVEKNNLKVNTPLSLIGELDIVDEPVTTGGKLTGELSKFVSGMVITGPILKGAGLIDDAVGKLATVRQGASKGLVVDITVYDQTEANLAAFVKENEWAEGPIIDFLATDEEDSASVNILKRGLEGMVAGALADVTVLALVSSVRALKAGAKARAGKPLSEADEAVLLKVNEDVKTVSEFDPQASMPQPVKTADEAVIPQNDMPTAVATDAPVAPKAPDAPNAPKPVNAASEAPQAFPEAPKIEGVKASIIKKSKSAVPSIDREVLINRMTKARLNKPSDAPFELGEFSIPFNRANMQGKTPDALIEEVHQILRDEGVAKTMGWDNPTTLAKIGNEAADMLAKVTGQSGEQFRKNLNLTANLSVDQAQKIVAGKAIIEEVGSQINELTVKLSDLKASNSPYEDMENQVASQIELMLEVQANVKTLTTAGARATAAGAIKITGEGLRPDTIDRLIKFGGSKRLGELAEKLAATKDPLVIAKTIADMKNGSAFWRVTNEMFINNILSGYNTFLINIKGNFLHNVAIPIERMAGGLVGAALKREGAMDQFYEGLYHYANARTHFVQSVKMAAVSFKRGRTLLDNQVQNDMALNGNRTIIASDKLKQTSPNLSKIINGYGVAVRAPTERLLAPTDELFKQFAFRNRATAILTVQAHKLTKADLDAQGFKSAKEWVDAQMDETLHNKKTLVAKYKKLVEEGRVVNRAEDLAEYVAQNMGRANLDNKVAQQALRDAQAGTGTAPLAKGTIAYSIQKAAIEVPILRQVVPFIQTPTNLLVAGMKRFPLAQLSREKWRAEVFSKDPNIAAEATGRLVTGVALLGSWGMMHKEGLITGGGPTDYQMKKQWKAGPEWQPYSFKAGDTWIGYNRDDPLFTPIGLMADLADMGQYVQLFGEDGIDFQVDADILPAFALAIANNITSKSYMQSISDITNLISGGTVEEMSRFMKGRVAAIVVPYSGLMNNLNRDFVDPYQREIVTIMDHIRSKVPFASQGLPIRYDWLSGTPIMKPDYVFGTMVKHTRGKDETWKDVDAELQKVGARFTGAPRKIDGLTLRPEMVQDFNRIMGNTKRADGKFLLDAINDRINSTDYKNMGPYNFHDPEVDPRVDAINTVIQSFQTMAKALYKRENPKLFIGQNSAAAQYKKYLVTANPEFKFEGNLNKMNSDLLQQFLNK